MITGAGFVEGLGVSVGTVLEDELLYTEERPGVPALVDLTALHEVLPENPLKFLNHEVLGTSGVDGML